jgi:hypothetical protein
VDPLVIKDGAKSFKIPLKIYNFINSSFQNFVQLSFDFFFYIFSQIPLSFSFTIREGNVTPDPQKILGRHPIMTFDTTT